MRLTGIIEDAFAFGCCPLFCDQHRLSRFGWIGALLLASLLGDCSQPSQQGEVSNFHFVRGTYENPTPLDPVQTISEAQAALITQIDDGLTRVGKSLQIEPNLASSWSIDNDGKRYVFTLRNDVLFQDGSPLEPADVITALNRLLEARTQAKTGLSNVRDISLDASKRLVIDLTAPFPALLAILASAPAHIVRRQADGSFLGTGPYKVYAQDGNTKLELRRNDHYHLLRPFFASVTYEKFDEIQVAEKMQVGLVHDASLFQSLSAEPPPNSRVVMQSVPSPDTWMLVINLRDPILSDLAARRCLFAILPKADIVRRLLPLHRPAGGYLAPGLPGYDPDLPVQGTGSSSLCDPYKGQSIALEYPSYLPVTGDICRQLASAADAKAGIKIDCRSTDFTEMAQEMEHGHYHLCLLATTLDIPVPEFMFWTFEEGADLKLANVTSPRLSEWLTASRRATSDAQRAVIYKQMDQFEFQNILTINLSYPGHHSWRHACLRDYSLDISGPSYLWLAQIKLAPGCQYLSDFRDSG